MRRASSPKTLFTLLSVSVLLLAGASPSDAFVLCRAPDGHVAIENPVSFAQCHRDAESPAPSVADGALLAPAGEPCVDTPLLPAALRAPDAGKACAAPASVVVTTTLAVPACPPSAARSPARVAHELAARQGAQRALRTTVLRA